MIGDKVPIRRFLTRFWGGIGGTLPIIGGKVPIRRALARFWGGIGGVLPMIGDKVPIYRALAWFWGRNRRDADDDRRQSAEEGGETGLEGLP